MGTLNQLISMSDQEIFGKSNLRALTGSILAFHIQVIQLASEAISLPKPITGCLTRAIFSACQT